MLRLVTVVSTLMGVLPLGYSGGRVRRRLWGLPLQGLYLAVALFFVYREVTGAFRTNKDYAEIAAEFSGHAGNGSAQHLANWAIIRLIGEFSDTFSCIFGLLLAWRLVDLINLCLETCYYAKYSNIPLYARSSSLLEIFGLLVSNTIISAYNIIIGASPMFQYGSFIDIFETFPEVVMENYMFLMCLLIAEELQAIRLEVKRAEGETSENPTLPQVESFRLEMRPALSERMKNLRQHHLDVLELVSVVQRRFQGYIFVCLFGCFLNPIMMWYRVLLEVGSLANNQRVRTVLRLSNYFIMGLVHIFSIWVLCKGPQTIQDQLTELDLELHKMEISGSLPRATVLEVFYMRKQCQLDRSEIQIFGMFSLNTSFFFSMLVGIISYITVLKQFNVDGRSFTNPIEFLEIHRYYVHSNESLDHH